MSDRTGRTSVDVAVPVRECLQFASTLPQNNRRTGQGLCPDAGIGRVRLPGIVAEQSVTVCGG